MQSQPAIVRTIYDGWEANQTGLINSLRGLSDDQLGLKPAPHQWALWQIASHIAGSRMYWMHDVLREGSAMLRDMFRVDHTTVAGLPLEAAAWEDNEERPRSTEEIVDGLEATWALLKGCLDRWTEADLAVEFTRQSPRRTQTRSRQWVVWHLIEHDLHHGGEICNILGSHGLPAQDI